MKRQEQEFITEVIEEMAEKEFSLRCPVCGGKKTKKSKTCVECSRKDRSVKEKVEKAVNDYQQPVKELVEVDKITRLSSEDWENRQKEVRAIVEDAEEGGKKCRNEWIFEDLQDSHENYTDELCWSIVRTFRRRQKCRELILRCFEIDGYSYDRETLIENILDLDNKFKYGEVSYIVDEVALAEMRKLAKGKVTRRDLSGSAYSRACQISDKKGGIYGVCFKKLIRAVAEEMAEKKEVMARNEEERKKVDAKRKARKDERKKNGQNLREQILSRSRVNLRTRTGQDKFGFPVKSREEASLLKHNSIVVFDGSVYQVIKTTGGKVNLKPLDLLFSNPSGSSNSTKNTKHNRLPNLDTAWVMCREVASEATKAFHLTGPQVIDSGLISRLPLNSYVIKDGAGGNGASLFEAKNGRLIPVGLYRIASKEEIKKSDEYRSEQKSL